MKSWKEYAIAAQRECDSLRETCDSLRKSLVVQRENHKRLIETINALPFVPHTANCLAFDTVVCQCGAATHNSALQLLRQEAGLEQAPC